MLLVQPVDDPLHTMLGRLLEKLNMACVPAWSAGDRMLGSGVNVNAKVYRGGGIGLRP